MTIKNKKTGTTVNPSIVYRKGVKCVAFSGVSMKIDSSFFKKHWAIINE